MMDLPSVTRSLASRDRPLKPGERVWITLHGTVAGTEPGQVHMQVEYVRTLWMGGWLWEERFTGDPHPVATVKDWAG
jgi:hypothetical protein